MSVKGRYLLDKDKISGVIAAYNSGSSMLSISKSYNVSSGTIRNILLREGVELRPIVEPHDDPTTKRCTRCKLVKPLLDFSVSRKTRTGRCDGCKQCQKEYVASTKESRAVTGKKWRDNNRARRVATEIRRRARKLRATPTWADSEAILKFYETAQGISMLLGEWYHVDHIVPLTSKFVCGLHCEANLQVILGVDNCAKQNLWWPDMWEPLIEKEETSEQN